MENEKFTIGEMLEMQNILQDKHKDKWMKIEPKSGKSKLLWLIGEVGEVIDVLKKKGTTQIMEDKETRENFVEELTDVLMYYNDILNCYGITEKELKDAYVKKFEKNMERSYSEYFQRNEVENGK